VVIIRLLLGLGLGVGLAGAATLSEVIKKGQ